MPERTGRNLECLLTFGTAIKHKSVKRYSSTVTGLEWPRGFQEVKVPRFHDNGTGC